MKNTVLVASLCISTLCVFNFIEASDLENGDPTKNEDTKVAPVKKKKKRINEKSFKPTTTTAVTLDLDDDQEQSKEEAISVKNMDINDDNDDDDDEATDKSKSAQSVVNTKKKKKKVRNKSRAKLSKGKKISIESDGGAEQVDENTGNEEDKQSQKKVTFDADSCNRGVFESYKKRLEQLKIFNEVVSNYYREEVLKDVSTSVLNVLTQVASTKINGYQIEALEWVYLCNYCLKNLELAKARGYKDIEVGRNIYLQIALISQGLQPIFTGLKGQTSFKQKIFQYYVNINKYVNASLNVTGNFKDNCHESCESLKKEITNFMAGYRIPTLNEDELSSVAQAYEKYQKFINQEKATMLHEQKLGNKIVSGDGPYRDIDIEITHTDPIQYQKMVDYQKFIAESVSEDIRERLITINPALSVKQFYPFDWLVVSNLILSILQRFAVKNEQISWLKLFDEKFEIFNKEILIIKAVLPCWDEYILERDSEDERFDERFSEVVEYQKNFEEISKMVSGFIKKKKKKSTAKNTKTKQNAKKGTAPKKKLKKTNTTIEKTDLNAPIDVTSLTENEEFRRNCEEAVRIISSFMKENGIHVLDEEKFGEALELWKQRPYSNISD